MPRDQIVARLELRHQEHQIAAGLTLNGGLVELWATEDRGAWTMLLTLPNNISCVIGAGLFWQDIPKRPDERSAL